MNYKDPNPNLGWTIQRHASTVCFSRNRQFDRRLAKVAPVGDGKILAAALRRISQTRSADLEIALRKSTTMLIQRHRCVTFTKSINGRRS
jgi:hypothetical protein